MNLSSLKFENPKGETARKVAEIADEYAIVKAKVRASREAEQQAGRDLHALREAAVVLERRDMLGEDTTADLRKHAAEVKRVTALRDQPWAMRVRAGEDALRVLEQRGTAMIRDNWDEIAGELQEQAEAAKSAVDEALADVMEAYREHVRVSHHAMVVLGVFGSVTPGEVPGSNLERVAREIDRVLESGGETLPAPKRDPRVQEEEVLIAFDSAHPFGGPAVGRRAA